MIKINYDIKNYRKDIKNLVNPKDTIIELGCHTGGTTKMLPETCNIIALDNSPEAPEKLRELPHVKFIHGDVRLHEVLGDVYQITQRCDILAIDLGGGYHPDTVFKVFYIWSSTFKPSHTVIRNRGILEFVNSSKPCVENYSTQKGYLESYHDSGIPPQIKEFDLWTPEIRK